MWNTNSDFRLTPCAGENVRVAGAIRLPASVRRRGIDLTISLVCALFLSLKAEGVPERGKMECAFARGKVEDKMSRQGLVPKVY